LFSVVIVSGGSFMLVTSVLANTQPKGGSLPDYLNNHSGQTNFGNNLIGQSTDGWLDRANVSYAISFTTNQSYQRYLIVDVYLVPYGVSSSAVIYFNLYLNGNLVKNSSIVPSGTLYAPPKSMSLLSTSPVELANFTEDVIDLNMIYYFNDTLPTGTIVTVTTMTTQPLWFSLGNSTVSESQIYSSANPAPQSLPTGLLSTQSTGYSESAYPVSINLASIPSA
jgi:hypothetical protein